MTRGVETRELIEEIAISPKARKEAIRELRDDTNGILVQARAELNEIYTHLHDILAEVRPELVQAEAERVKQFAADLKKTQAELKEMFRQVAAMLAKIRPALSQAEAERLREFTAELKERQADLKEMFRQVAAMLAKIRPVLSQADAERLREFTAELKERQAATKNRLATVNELLTEFSMEREKAAAAWQNLAGIIQGRKGAPITTTEPEEKAALSDSVFAYLGDHPDGTRMAKLETEFGVARIKMVQILKGLMSEGKVEKRDMLYFTV